MYYDPSVADNGTIIIARYTDKKLTYRIMNSGVSFGGNGTYNFDGKLIGEFDCNMNSRDIMYNRHHSKYLPANFAYIGNSDNWISEKVYPPNATKMQKDYNGTMRDQLKSFTGVLTWNDYTRYDHGPLASNYGYNSDIKTTSISSQGHVVAFLRCKDLSSEPIGSVFYPPTGIKSNSYYNTEYKRAADSHWTKMLHDKDTTRRLMFTTTIKGINPGTAFTTDINHVVENTNPESRNNKFAIRPQPFELSKDGNSIVVGSGLYRKNVNNQYLNSFLMKNPWDDVNDLSKYFEASYPPELIDNSINKDGTVIASLWGPQYDEVYEKSSHFVRNSQNYTREPDMTSQYGLPIRNYMIQVFTSGENASFWQRQTRFFKGNRCKHISLTASGDLVAYTMTEDNWHNNYFKNEDFWKSSGSRKTLDDPRKGYINFLEVESIGHKPPT